MRLDAALQNATEWLSASSDSPRLDAEIMLCQALDVARSYLFAHPEDELDAVTAARFRAQIERRAAGEPMAYITGTREFWSHELLVSPATLVPRPETECLVERALREIPRHAAMNILDLGTGSGAIAIAIAAERPLCDVTATDASTAALAIARQNVRSAELPNVECLRGDWTTPVRGRTFDLIVSNPPYVASGDEALSALQHEPLQALVSGTDGLDAIRTLARDCRDLLVDDGWLMLEHGAGQRTAVASLLHRHGWTGISCHNDLAGLARVTAARKGGT